MPIDWNNPEIVESVGGMLSLALLAFGGFFAFRPAVDWLRIRISGHQPNISWQRFLASP